MTSFSSESKVFSGPESPQIFNPKVPLGQILLYYCSAVPEKVIQIDEHGVEIKCSEMSEMMRKVSAFLVRKKLQLGDVVGLCGRNTSFMSPVVCGSILLGITLSPVHISLDVDVICGIYSQTKPKIIFCDHDQVTKLEEVFRAMDCRAQIVTLDKKLEGFAFIKEIFEDESAEIKIPFEFDIPADKICAAILPSSGSTGAPKLAQVCHAMLTERLFTFYGFADDQLLLNFYTSFWVSGFCSMVHSILSLNPRLISSQPFSPQHCVELIQRHQVTQLSLTPTDLILLREYLEENSLFLPSVLVITTGGWFISKEAIEAMEARMPNGRVIPIYALTESSGFVSRSDIRKPASSSVGQLCVNTHVKILLDDDSLGGIRDVGEILIKRPANIIGYLNNEKQTREVIDEDGWIHTGDMGYFDEELELFIVGRKKFMIRCSNRRVNPADIEEIIEKLPGVLKVCVVAVPRDEYYEAPGAVIEVRSNCNLSVDEVKKALVDLEDFKQLYGGVFFVEKLPLTATGKVNRNEVEKIALRLDGQA